MEDCRPELTSEYSSKSREDSRYNSKSANEDFRYYSEIETRKELDTHTQIKL